MSDSKGHLRYSPRPKRDWMKRESEKERKNESEAMESSVSPRRLKVTANLPVLSRAQRSGLSACSERNPIYHYIYLS